MTGLGCVKDKIHRNRRGSMTVEAVFAVPLVLLAVFFTLSYGFFEYQKIWFTAAAYEAALTQDGEEEKASARIQEAAVGIGLPTCQVFAVHGKTEVTYRGTALILMGKYSLEYQASGKVSRPNPVKYIRNVKMIDEVYEEWKGGGDGS